MTYDVIVIGGGIVGLATALKIKEKNPKVSLAVLEKEPALAMHQTGHNSGVIHSGLYYKPGSLKAKKCIEGYAALISFCEDEEIPFELCGKVVVATEKKELPLLENLYKRGIENGLSKIKKIGPQEIRNHEPYCEGISGIYVPYTGIVDYVAVAHKYAERLSNQYEGEIFLSNKVIDLHKGNKHYTIVTEKHAFYGSLVINCSGLYSDKITQLGNLPEENPDIKIIPFRGEYYELKREKEHLVKNLIYPVPDPNFPFLGVHFTRMIKGGVEAGPNAVLAYKREGYSKKDLDFQEFIETIKWPGFQKVGKKYWKTGFGEIYRSYSKKAFTKALQRLIPDIQETDLIPGGAGVRAQACDKNGNLLDDFAFHNSGRMINVCNAPSPAATSSLSIGNTVSDMALKRLEDLNR